ncbi:E3 ubiquitin-protein ligase MPSR1 [Cardamine amara subsp. amara]|uniref:RING-type E3 ubiquitin transferase n=1 Tax=Cardamine amara subsp. amara TaxID=228776 RepID=A0ABD1AII7_CARAN
MEAVPELNYQVERDPEPEKVGKVDLNIAFVRPINMDPILTRSSFSCSLLAKEFIEDEDYPYKQQLHYFLTESGVDRRDAIVLILKLIRLAREVTLSVIYCPRYALLMWLTLDVVLVPLSEESYLEEMRKPYLDDYRIDEKIQASVHDYVESCIDDSQIEEVIQAPLDEHEEESFLDDFQNKEMIQEESYIDDSQIEEVIQAPFDEYEEESLLDEFQTEEMIQASRDEYEESFFYDSQIEEVIPASLVEYKFRPASKLKVKSLERSFIKKKKKKSLRRRTYKNKRETISIADQCKIYKRKRKTSSNYDKCTICLENYDSKREVVTLPCGHIFDNQCIVEWLGIGHVCPLCRFKFPCEADEIPQTQMPKVF